MLGRRLGGGLLGFVMDGVDAYVLFACGWLVVEYMCTIDA